MAEAGFSFGLAPKATHPLTSVLCHPPAEKVAEFLPTTVPLSLLPRNPESPRAETEILGYSLCSVAQPRSGPSPRTSQGALTISELGTREEITGEH